MESVRVDQVRAGDRILCPGDGRDERVSRVEPRSRGRRFIRTDRHDHVRGGNELLFRVTSARPVA